MVRTIAFFGPVGTYTEEAAILYDPDAELKPFPTIAAVALAVSSAVTDHRGWGWAMPSWRRRPAPGCRGRGSPASC